MTKKGKQVNEQYAHARAFCTVIKTKGLLNVTVGSG